MENNLMYKEKYLKYKDKYLNLKNKLNGGSPFDEDLQKAIKESQKSFQETASPEQRYNLTEFMLDNIINNGQKIIEVPADGNCFFYSISLSLNSDTRNSPKELRKRLSQSLKSVSDLKDNLTEELKKGDIDLSEEGQWIDSEHQIQRMSSVIKRPIHVYQNYDHGFGPVRVFSEKNIRSSAKPVFIAHYTNQSGNGLHYDAVVNGEFTQDELKDFKGKIVSSPVIIEKESSPVIIEKESLPVTIKEDSLPVIKLPPLLPPSPKKNPIEEAKEIIAKILKFEYKPSN